jgi:PAS domain S-box-containing protein
VYVMINKFLLYLIYLLKYMSDELSIQEMEDARLLCLQSYRIIDSMPEKEYYTIARLGSYISKKPICTISFLGKDNHYVKSSFGVNLDTPERQKSIDKFTVLGTEFLEIPDTLADPRTSDLHCVTEAPFIRYYAGSPIISPDGFILGSLSVMDTVPGNLDETQKEAILDLTNNIVSHLEARIDSYELAVARSSSADLKTLFNSSKEVLSIMDRWGKIIVVNEVAEELFGYTADEGQGRPIWEFFVEEDIISMIPGLEEGLKSGQKKFDIEARIKLKEGGTKWIAWTVTFQNEKWYVVGRDISDHKRMSDQIEQLSLNADNLNSGVVISDSHGQIIWTNDSFEGITGYNFEDVKGQTIVTKLFEGNADAKLLERTTKRPKNKLPFTIDLLASRKDGSAVWLSVFNSFILDSAGHIYKEIAVLTDITATKNA